ADLCVRRSRRNTASPRWHVDASGPFRSTNNTSSWRTCHRLLQAWPWLLLGGLTTAARLGGTPLHLACQTGSSPSGCRTRVAPVDHPEGSLRHPQPCEPFQPDWAGYRGLRSPPDDTWF